MGWGRQRYIEKVPIPVKRSLKTRVTVTPNGDCLLMLPGGLTQPPSMHRGVALSKIGSFSRERKDDAVVAKAVVELEGHGTLCYGTSAKAVADRLLKLLTDRGWRPIGLTRP